jgi:hypothetical protein
MLQCLLNFNTKTKQDLSFLQLDWRVVIKHCRVHRPRLSWRRCMDVTEMDIWLHGRGKEKSITTCIAEQKKRKTERT